MHFDDFYYIFFLTDFLKHFSAKKEREGERNTTNLVKVEKYNLKFNYAACARAHYGT